MQERTFENLILNGEDLFLEGGITISSKFEMKDANLIVSGNLTILCYNDNFEVENSKIIVSGDLTINCESIKIKSVDISCNYLCCANANIDISDGDIWINTDLDCLNIISDGNIEVGGNSSVENIICLNYLVTGDNNSYSINASQDIYILNYNDSYDLTAREILIDGDCFSYSITAHHFVCTGELSCEGLFIE